MIDENGQIAPDQIVNIYRNVNFEEEGLKLLEVGGKMDSFNGAEFVITETIAEEDIRLFTVTMNRVIPD